MVVLMILLAGVAVAAIAATLVTVLRDGYRRIPTRENP